MVTTVRQRGVGTEWEPDTILPGQIMAGTRLDASLQPEKRLMLAVLEDAIATLQRNALANNYRGRRLFKEALEWCASDADDWTFAFVNVCQALGIEVPYLRGGLRRWIARLRAESTASRIVVRTPFRRIGGSRTRVTELRYSA